MGKQFLLYSPEAYSEPCQESNMKLFQSLPISAKNSILYVCQGSEYVQKIIKTNKLNKVKTNQDRTT